MDKILKDISLFVEVARRKSFSQAADNLDMPVSTVSRRIAALERELGIPLFLRNSRNVELTDSGKLFQERCEFIVSEVELVRENVLHHVKSPAGKVRIAMRPDSYFGHLADALTNFAARWPEISLHVHLSDRRVDLLTEPFDLELRIGPQPDSSLKARTLGTVRLKLFASPRLFERYDIPQTPRDLRKVPCIVFPEATRNWDLYDRDERKEEVQVLAAHSVNNLGVAMDFALAGMGVSWLAGPPAEPHLKNGNLVRVLPDWKGIPIDISIVMASSQLPRRVRLLLDYLVEMAREQNPK